MLRFLFLTLLVCFLTQISNAQILDFRKDDDKHELEGEAGDSDPDDPFEWLDEGFFNIGQSGSTQASVSVLRLRIGEKKGFNVPLYFLITSPGAGLGGGMDDKQLSFARFIVPTGGLVNVAFNDSKSMTKLGDQTALSFSYHLGYKLNSGINDIEENVLYSSGFFDLGLRFVTGAWLEDDEKKNGSFFVQTKLFGAYASQQELKALISPNTSDFFVGFSLDAGIFIADAVDIRFSLSSAMNNDTVTEIDRFTFNFSVDYSLNAK